MDNINTENEIIWAKIVASNDIILMGEYYHFVDSSGEEPVKAA